jgi:hypothetical protein
VEKEKYKKSGLLQQKGARLKTFYSVHLTCGNSPGTTPSNFTAG